MSGSADQKRVTDLLAELVSIESVNLDMPGATRGEKPYSDFIAGYGRKLGLDVSQDEVLPGRPNVLLRMRRSGAARTLLFDIHLDTVPLEGERANTKAFTEDGRLYGRGACDTKASMAAALLAFERLIEDPPEPTCDIALLGTVDEEYLKRGVDLAIERGLRADAAVVGEPTGLRPVIAHKGVVRWEIVTRGRAAHTSRPENGVNAIYAMLRVVEALRNRFETGGVVPPHPLCGDSTLVVSKISGGVQVNIVPAECRIEIDRRNIPGETPADFLHAMNEEIEALRRREPWIDVESRKPYLVEHGVDTDAGLPIVRCVTTACRELGLPSAPEGVPYGTDAAGLQPVGIPSVILGPGSVAQAHSPEEWVEISQVADCVAVYERVARSYARDAGE